MTKRRAYRMVDEERIDGTWRPVFVRNGDTYFLTDLIVYADGVVECWGLLTLDELRAKLDSGWITVTPRDGARASAFELATWEFAHSYDQLTADDLFAEVRNEMDRLAGRPTAEARCDEAVEVFRRAPTEENRSALREAYLAVPEHERMYLGDMDVKDWPYRALTTPAGEPLDGDGDPVTAEDHAEALEFFADRARAADEADTRRHADGPAGAGQPTVVLDTVFGSWPGPPSVHVLRAEYPAPVEVGGHTYPTLSRAYLALAAADPGVRDAIRGARSDWDARRLLAAGGHRPEWTVAREAVVAELHRARCRQHPELAEVLLATGDARIEYRGTDSGFLDARDRMGRVLEQVRSELAAARAGLL
ncbi:NADAR family protein [Longispora sp. NPDC051575]|uniref:NADAR family protein n=1 Tax=Longispora sp. NPDC051575 TaxID=3154943 RepID=UPI003449C723